MSDKLAPACSRHGPQIEQDLANPAAALSASSTYETLADLLRKQVRHLEQMHCCFLVLLDRLGATGGRILAVAIKLARADNCGGHHANNLQGPSALADKDAVRLVMLYALRIESEASRWTAKACGWACRAGVLGSAGFGAPRRQAPVHPTRPLGCAACSTFWTLHGCETGAQR